MGGGKGGITKYRVKICDWGKRGESLMKYHKEGGRDSPRKKPAVKGGRLTGRFWRNLLQQGVKVKRGKLCGGLKPIAGGGGKREA